MEDLDRMVQAARVASLTFQRLVVLRVMCSDSLVFNYFWMGELVHQYQQGWN